MSEVDLKILAEGLELLIFEMTKAQDQGCEDRKALINLRFAQREANAGNVARAVEHLMKAGKRIEDVAAEMGISVITEAIRSQVE